MFKKYNKVLKEDYDDAGRGRRTGGSHSKDGCRYENTGYDR